MPAAYLHDDIPIFFEDFAESIVLDGVVVTAIVEALSAAPSQGEAIERCDLGVHLRTADVPAQTVSRAGGLITINGQNFTVVDRLDDLGVTHFRLLRGRGY